MATTRLDLIGGEYRIAGRGRELRRLGVVSGLTGTAAARFAEAERASGMPRLGDRHPSLPDLSVVDIKISPPRADDTGRMEVEITYADVQGSGDAVGDVTVSVRSELLTEETIRDINGDLIGTRYSVNINNPTFTLNTVQEIVQRVEVQRPTFALDFTRIETRSGLEAALKLSGSVNRGTFQRQPSHTWLCAVDSDQLDATRHRVRYAFTYNAKTWRAEIKHTSGGLIPTDVTVVNGISFVDVYPLVDFGGLGLPRL